jgi:hypothetical protein
MQLILNFLFPLQILFTSCESRQVLANNHGKQIKQTSEFACQSPEFSLKAGMPHLIPHVDATIPSSPPNDTRVEINALYHITPYPPPTFFVA